MAVEDNKFYNNILVSHYCNSLDYVLQSLLSFLFTIKNKTFMINWNREIRQAKNPLKCIIINLKYFSISD